MRSSRSITQVFTAVVLATIPIACSSGREGTGVVLRTPAAMQIVNGEGQQGVVGEELSEPLVVRVVDENDEPVPDQLVNFRVIAGGGDVFAGSGITNSQGIVQERWTLGTSTAEAQRVEARAVDSETGQAIVFATFTATPLPGPVSVLEKPSGDEQSGELGRPLPALLVVRAVDQYDNPVPDVAVTWAIASGGGSLGDVAQATGADGTASAAWTLGPRLAEPQRVTVSVSGHAASYTANPSLPADADVSVSGGGQAAIVGQALTQPLVVRIELSSGVPVVGASVTWATPDGGSLAPAQTATNDEGEASAVWTLGPTAGQQGASAHLPGRGPVTVTATARAAAPASLTIISGSGQIAPVGSRLPQPFIVEVKDAFGNVVPDAPVAWSILVGGGTLSNASGATGADGRAQATYELGTTAVRNEVRATVASLAPITFVADATTGGAARLEKLSGDGQEGRVGVPLAEPLVVRVLDQYDNPIHHEALVAKVVSGGGWFTVGSPSRETIVHSDEAGHVRIPFVPGGALAPQRVQVIRDESVVEFTATAQPFLMEKLSLDSPTCGVTPDSRLACWTPMATFDNGTVYSMPERRFANASISLGHGCAVETTGALWCWGSNRVGQLGDGTFTNAGPVRALLDVGVERVLTGYLNTCAVATDGEVYCWGVGSSSNSQSCRSVFFANDFVACTPVPTEVPAARGVTSLDLAMGMGAYAQSSVGLVNGVVHAGSVLGGPTGASSEPFPPLVVIDRGQSHTCGLTSAGEAWCSGRLGVIGDGSSYIESLTATRQVAGPHAFVSISAGNEETCAITNQGDAYCWGQHFGRVPTPVPGGLRFREVRIGVWGSSALTVACGITTGGALACWGWTDGGWTLQRTPVYVSWPVSP